MASSDKKLIVWVGGSSGLGLAAIEHLLSTLSGFHIVLGSRSALTPHVQHQLDPLLKKSHSTLDRVECNLASYDSVRKFATQIKTKYAPEKTNIDGLVLCAGMIEGAPRKTKDGEDEMLQVNVLSHALLIDLLEDRIGVDGKYSRVLLVGSTLHRKVLPGSCTPETLPDAWKEFDPNQVYQITKFVQIYLLYMTVQRFETTKPTVTVVVVSPGFVPDTGLSRELGTIRSGLMHYIMPKTPFATTIPDGGRHIIKGLTGSYVSGTYVTQRGVEDTAEDTYHEDLRAAWNEWFIAKDIWHPPAPAPTLTEPSATGAQLEVQPVQAELAKEGAPATATTAGPTAPATAATEAPKQPATAAPADASPTTTKALPVQPVTNPTSGVPQQAPVVEGAATAAPAAAATPAPAATASTTAAAPAAATPAAPAAAAAADAKPDTPAA
ncbi:hypothetical protein M407DRAFT_242584 [Tulasnella calospora MUT 4182]|uniref:Ketoreductase (KR) domain-containing protein n=2 Tax=Tulasnella calospora MUT 4182 TaxID=1051891 RepID=A0A0C3QEC0_9AGAM|nr:hypothetical protein M407DRAFT_242584 [Tulasnella calospora MUT 4182]